MLPPISGPIAHCFLSHLRHACAWPCNLGWRFRDSRRGLTQPADALVNCSMRCGPSLVGRWKASRAMPLIHEAALRPLLGGNEPWALEAMLLTTPYPTAPRGSSPEALPAWTLTPLLPRPALFNRLQLTAGRASAWPSIVIARNGASSCRIVPLQTTQEAIHTSHIERLTWPGSCRLVHVRRVTSTSAPLRTAVRYDWAD